MPLEDGGAGPDRQQGRRVGDPGEKLAYVEISTSTTGLVGFRS